MICDECAYCDYDEQNDEYICVMNLDEDEIYRFLQGGKNECRFYTPYDEYKIVRKQN